MSSPSKLSILKGPTRRLIPEQLHSIFVDTAKINPHEIALQFTENGVTRSSSYLEVDYLSNRLAKVILERIENNNLKRNSDGDYIIAVSMYPTDYLVVLLLAILKAGAAYLPLDPTFSQYRVEHILKEAKPALVIFDQDYGYFINTFKLSRTNLFKLANKFEATPLSGTLKHANSNLAVLLYTSGSTGFPKGVRLSHTMILNRLQWQFNTFPFSETEKTCVFKTTLTFVDSVIEIWGALLYGRTLLVVQRNVLQNPEQLVSVLEKNKIERLMLVPSLLRSLLMYFNLHKNRKFLTNLKIWVSTGEILEVSLITEFYNYFPVEQHKLCNYYGSTEVSDVTYHVVTNPDKLTSQDQIPIGLPIDNTIIYLLDSNFQPVPVGEVGEVYVAGASLPDSYVNGRDPDKFIENSLTVDPAYKKLYKMGDFARISKGTLLFEGRTDSQIKIRGYRVDLLEVEKAVNAIQGIDNGVVFCYKPGEINQTLLAFVLSESSLNEQQIEVALKNVLPAYMVPQVVLIERIPLLINGKTDRQTLLKYYETSVKINNDEVSFQGNIDYTGVPQHQEEAAKALFETVASVLNILVRKTISVDANFYEIGGNSLNSIVTITCLNELGYHISVGDFIAAEDLGEIIDRMSADKLESSRKITKCFCYIAEPLRNEHKTDVIDMITTAFYQKADLKTEISELDYSRVVELFWKDFLAQELSFVVKTEFGKSVGVSLCFDAWDVPEIELNSRLEHIRDLLESIEVPILENELPKGKGKILQYFMMGTNESLAAQENIAVTQFMEEEVIRWAKIKNFAGVFTTNTNLLTQQLATSMYGYKTYLDYQVNQFVAKDGTKPFALVPDSQRALVQWREV